MSTWRGSTTTPGSTVPTSNLWSSVVLDTTVISNFSFTDDLASLIDDPDAQIVTVPAVIDEVRAGDEDPGFLAGIEGEPDVIEVDGDPNDEILDRMDHGEAYALRAAIVENGTLATDDLAARELADEQGIPVTGSIGLLVRLIRRDVFTVDEADDVLSRWIEGSGLLFAGRKRSRGPSRRPGLMVAVWPVFRS